MRKPAGVLKDLNAYPLSENDSHPVLHMRALSARLDNLLDELASMLSGIDSCQSKLISLVFTKCGFDSLAALDLSLAHMRQAQDKLFDQLVIAKNTWLTLKACADSITQGFAEVNDETKVVYQNIQDKLVDVSQRFGNVIDELKKIHHALPKPALISTPEHSTLDDLEDYVGLIKAQWELVRQRTRKSLLHELNILDEKNSSFKTIDKSQANEQAERVKFAREQQLIAKLAKENNKYYQQHILINDINLVDNDKYFGELNGKRQTHHRRSDLYRLKKHIRQLIFHVREVHLKNNFNSDMTLRHDCRYRITRLCTSEFAFYTEKPLSINDFQSLIQHLEKLAYKNPENLHLMLSTFAVNLDGRIMNVCIYVQCGISGSLSVFAKARPSKIDPDYNQPLYSQHDVAKSDTTPFVSPYRLEANGLVISHNNIVTIRVHDMVFTQVIDICLDYRNAHGRRVLEQTLLGESEILVSPLSNHVITSAGIDYNSRLNVSNSYRYIDKHDAMEGLSLQDGRYYQKIITPVFGSLCYFQVSQSQVIDFLQPGLDILRREHNRKFLKRRYGLVIDDAFVARHFTFFRDQARRERKTNMSIDFLLHISQGHMLRSFYTYKILPAIEVLSRAHLGICTKIRPVFKLSHHKDKESHLSSVGTLNNEELNFLARDAAFYGYYGIGQLATVFHRLSFGNQTLLQEVLLDQQGLCVDLNILKELSRHIPELMTAMVVFLIKKLPSIDSSAAEMIAGRVHELDIPLIYLFESKVPANFLFPYCVSMQVRKLLSRELLVITQLLIIKGLDAALVKAVQEDLSTCHDIYTLKAALEFDAAFDVQDFYVRFSKIGRVSDAVQFNSYTLDSQSAHFHFNKEMLIELAAHGFTEYHFSAVAGFSAAHKKVLVFLVKRIGVVVSEAIRTLKNTPKNEIIIFAKKIEEISIEQKILFSVLINYGIRASEAFDTVNKNDVPHYLIDISRKLSYRLPCDQYRTMNELYHYVLSNIGKTFKDVFNFGLFCRVCPESLITPKKQELFNYAVVNFVKTLSSVDVLCDLPIWTNEEKKKILGSVIKNMLFYINNGLEFYRFYRWYDTHTKVGFSEFWRLLGKKNQQWVESEISNLYQRLSKEKIVDLRNSIKDIKSYVNILFLYYRVKNCIKNQTRSMFSFSTDKDFTKEIIEGRFLYNVVNRLDMNDFSDQKVKDFFTDEDRLKTNTSEPLFAAVRGAIEYLYWLSKPLLLNISGEDQNNNYVAKGMFM